MRTTLALVAVAAVFVAGGLRLSADAGQRSGPVTPPRADESMYGPDLYRHYCATCHGRDAKGQGPAASALKVPPPDLTLLARGNKGVFPVARVETVIRSGTGVTAHGSDEMPVWGPIFLALDPSDARVKVRITSLASYLASIQER